MKPKKKNQQDLTLRNLRALKKELDKLKAFTFFINGHVHELEAEVTRLKRQKREKR